MPLLPSLPTTLHHAVHQLLKNYCRNRGLKTAITVGVIGYPNVGKSSVINSLKRAKVALALSQRHHVPQSHRPPQQAASVSSQPGHTKKMQEVG